MQVLKEAIRNKILQAAEEVFYAKDYRSARLVDIAKKAGVPVALIYTYFKNIEGYSENKYDESLYYLISCTFIEGVLEIARGYRNAKWAKNMMSLLMQCHFLGVQSL